MRLVRICLAAALVLAAQPVAAQESGTNEIKVINEDGSVSVFEMPESPQGVPVARPLTKMERMLMEQEQQAPVKAEVAAPEPEKKAAPADAVKLPAAVKKAVAPERKEGESVMTQAAHEFPPVPGRKPGVSRPRPVVAERESAAPQPVSPEAVISKNRAVSIAIDHAPPSSDFQVFRKMMDGRRVYEIVFKTDGGDVPVIVDAASGDVIRP